MEEKNLIFGKVQQKFLCTPNFKPFTMIVLLICLIDELSGGQPLFFIWLVAIRS